MSQLLQNAVYGGAVILAVAGLRRALKNRLIPEVRLALWAVCLFRLLTPVAPTSALSLWGLFGREVQDAPGPVNPVNVSHGAGISAPAPAAPSPAPAETGLPWGTVLAAAWIAVGVLLAARYALVYVRTRRAVGLAVPIERIDARYAALPRCARLREGPMDGAPLTFGVMRPTVVLSPGLDGTALECVLAHEAVHARRRDNLWHYAMALAQVVYWWNPAVWLMARLLRRDVELSCDRAAVRKLGADRRAEYAQTLVSMATTAEGPAFCQTFGRKAAEERIISIMKYKKVTVIGAALSLALVLAVTVGFASGPAEPVANKQPYNPFDHPELLVSCGDANNDGVMEEYTIDMRLLEQSLAKQVAKGELTREKADEMLEWAKGFTENGEGYFFTWMFDIGSGLTTDEKENVFYRDGNGNLVPVDLETVVSSIIFPAAGQDAAAGTVEYHGRTYNRADLSQETLDWLDWYLALPEAEQLAVSYEPWELRDTRERVGVTDVPGQPSGETGLAHDSNGPEDSGKADPPAPAESEIPEFVPDYDPNVEDSARTFGEPICNLPTAPTTNCGVEGCTVSGEHHHEGSTVVYHYNTLPIELHVCPVEGCTVRGTHTHDGVTYLCNGAHCGGVCDGSCAAAWNEADTTPTAAPVSDGHHSDSHHGSGYHGGHH